MRLHEEAQMVRREKRGAASPGWSTVSAPLTSP